MCLFSLLIENSSARNIKMYERFGIRDRILKNKIATLETHLEELKQYYFTTRELDGYIIKYHSLRLDKLDNNEY